MPDRTPTTEQVRSKYATVLDDVQGWRHSEEWGHDFDRWRHDHVTAALHAALHPSDDQIEQLAEGLRAHTSNPATRRNQVRAVLASLRGLAELEVPSDDG